jgi:hypothetical protein
MPVGVTSQIQFRKSIGQAETKLGLYQVQQVTTENAAKGHIHKHTAHVNMASLEHNDRYEAGYRIRKEVM